ncbi:MAG TPA: ABC transporter ATP-binding protein [Caulobacteraceae bacterium]|jgi:osmoprotectant transport system ATP-binding protein
MAGGPGRPLIEIRGAAKRYGGANAAGPLDLTIAAGEFVALLGGSGSGKTTTLKMINGLIAPDAGQVVIDGAPADGEPPHLLRRRIGYVFQEIGLFPHLTVGENIAVGPRLAGWDKARIAARGEELLSLVALPAEAATKLPGELSGGQRQRVGVARALGAGPAIMLMDEPFGALDPVIREGLGADYRALHQRLGLTTVMVTHDVMEALLLADRIVVLEAGKILADDTPAALLADHPAPGVRALMETPRRQAARVEALAAAGRGA